MTQRAPITMYWILYLWYLSRIKACPNDPASPPNMYAAPKRLFALDLYPNFSLSGPTQAPKVV